MTIDVKQILKDKAPKVARFMPDFVVKYIARTIHQDEINYVLANYGHMEGVEFISKTLDYMNVKYTVHGKENLTPGKKYMIASNHPLGGLDGLILAKELNNILGDSKFIVNDILMNVSPIKSLFVPINKHGRQSHDYAKQLNALYESDSQIIMFPAGLCSRKIDGEIQDPVWHKNFIVKSIKYQRDIVPVYVDAKNSNFFYNLSRFRKAIGLNVNIEMLYLPDEMFRQKGKHIDIMIGKPISYTTFTKDKSFNSWAKEIRNIVYALKTEKK